MENKKVLLDGNSIIEFINACKKNPFENPKDQIEKDALQLRNMEQANMLVKCFDNFEKAMILNVSCLTGNKSGIELKSERNVIIVTLSVNTYLPGLDNNETYRINIDFGFQNPDKFEYTPLSIGKPAEIKLQSFHVDEKYVELRFVLRETEKDLLFISAENMQFDNFIKRYEKTAEIKNDAWTLYKNREYGKCINVLEKSKDDLKKDPEICNLLSLCYLKLANYSKAMSMINSAIELESDNSKYHYYKACVLKKCELYYESIKELETAYSLAKNNEEKITIYETLFQQIIKDSYFYKQIHDAEDFTKKIFYCDLMIQHEETFEELREKFKIYRQNLIQVCFKEIEYCFGLFKYDELRKYSSELLNVKDLDPLIKTEIVTRFNKY